MDSPAAPRSVRDWLAEARQRGVDRLDARLLISAVLQREPVWLMAHDDAPIELEEAARLDGWLRRRAAGEPLAYLIGRRAFGELVLQVDARVLDPRADTETLVDWALAWLSGPGAPSRPEVIDLGTGSGAIALSVAKARPDARVWAVDRSPDALAVAAANGRRLGLAVGWLQGDWFDGWQPWADADEAEAGGPQIQHQAAGLPKRFDLIVSNPPYIPEGDPHLLALRHEPRMALVSGRDGLDALRTLTVQAARHLRPGGALLLEHGHDQGPAVQALLEAAGGECLPAQHDLQAHWRCSGARWR